MLKSRPNHTIVTPMLILDLPYAASFSICKNNLLETQENIYTIKMLYVHIHTMLVYQQLSHGYLPILSTFQPMNHSFGRISAHSAVNSMPFQVHSRSPFACFV